MSLNRNGLNLFILLKLYEKIHQRVIETFPLSKKHRYFTVRLTVSVYPSSLRSAFFDIFFWCVIYLRLWSYVFWNGFHTRKVIFIQLQEFPTPPYCRCCSVTKRSDSGIAEALKALKMHFWDPSHWDKMSKFSHLLTVRADGADPPPPPMVSLTVKYPFLYESC